MASSSSDDDWFEDGLDLDDMGLIAEPDEPLPLMARLAQMALRFTMICIAYGALRPSIPAWHVGHFPQQCFPFVPDLPCLC